MSYRIEALRVHLENQMGDGLFIAAYKHLASLENDDEQDDNKLESLLKKKMKFVPLIHQLIVCEDSYYGNNWHNFNFWLKMCNDDIVWRKKSCGKSSSFKYFFLSIQICYKISLYMTA